MSEGISTTVGGEFSYLISCYIFLVVLVSPWNSFYLRTSTKYSLKLEITLSHSSLSPPMILRVTENKTQALYKSHKPVWIYKLSVKTLLLLIISIISFCFLSMMGSSISLAGTHQSTDLHFSCRISWLPLWVSLLFIFWPQQNCLFQGVLFLTCIFIENVYNILWS